MKIGGFGANSNVSIAGGAGWVLTGRDDDVRLRPGSPHAGIGLLDAP